MSTHYSYPYSKYAVFPILVTQYSRWNNYLDTVASTSSLWPPNQPHISRCFDFLGLENCVVATAAIALKAYPTRGKMVKTFQGFSSGDTHPLSTPYGSICHISYRYMVLQKNHLRTELRSESYHGTKQCWVINGDNICYTWNIFLCQPVLVSAGLQKMGMSEDEFPRTTVLTSFTSA